MPEGDQPGGPFGSLRRLCELGLAAVEDREGVAAAMRELTARQRAAIVLTQFVGYNSEEAGRILGVSPSTVRNLASQGREALRKLLGGGDD